METDNTNTGNTDSILNIETDSLKFVSKRKHNQPKKYLQNIESLNSQLSNSKSAATSVNKKQKNNVKQTKLTEVQTNIPVERKPSLNVPNTLPMKSPNPHTAYLKKNKILIEALISSYKQKRHYLSQQITSDNAKIGTVEDGGKTFRESKELTTLKNKISMLSLEIEKTKIELSNFTKNIKTPKYKSSEFLKNQLNFFNMNETLESLNKELFLILSRKALHIKKSITYLKTQKSRFNNFNVFRNFIFLELIGFGGFSEVYKGYDFLKGIYVALKIHKLEKSWTAFKRAEFTRRAKRECDIQCILDNPNIVKIIDNFSIDNETYCTVLEYVENSIDLETFIKERSKISEKSAKNIFAQILNGLKHLKDNNVIHYDLKPANILISDGVVKITDFGLSKQFPEMARVEQKDEPRDGKKLIEFDLTSAGAGTYHYLAPECFNDNAKISTRTDIWAVGCIFYQMLFGKKPFSEGLRAEDLWNNKGKHVLDNEIVFDNKVGISNNAKKIILGCLSNNVFDRPEVEDLINFDLFKR